MRLYGPLNLDSNHNSLLFIHMVTCPSGRTNQTRMIMVTNRIKIVKYSNKDALRFVVGGSSSSIIDIVDLIGIG